MKPIFVIKHVREGYYDEPRGKFNAFMFATEYSNEEDAVAVIYKLDLHETYVIKMYVHR
jgi:hypothetical protein